MASNGSFNTSSYSDRYLVFEWTQKTQSTANNYTVINWTLKGAGGSTTRYYTSGPFKVVIDGDVVFESSTRIDVYNGTTIASGEKVISHNTDGKRSFTASVSAAIYYSSNNVSGSGSWALNQIPRAATLTVASNFTDEDNPTITYSNPAGNSVTTLQACISLTGAIDDIKYRDISKTGTTYTFNLTDAERAVLRNATTTANSRKASFFIKTIIGGNTYYSTADRTVSIINAAPVITSASVVDKGSASKTLTGDTTKMIKGYNAMLASMTATVKKGATVASYKITNGSKVVNAASGAFDYTENNVFVFSVTDSRGNTDSKTITVPMVNYIKPTTNLDIKAPNADGTLNFAIKGNYFNGSFGAVNNTLTVQYRYKTNSGSYGSWTNAPTATLSGNTYTSNVSISGLNYQNYYTFQARSIDKIYSGINSEEKKIKTLPVFDWSDENFNFNVPIKLKGHTVLRHNEDNNNIVISTENSTDGIFLRPNGTGNSEGQLYVKPDGELKLYKPLAVVEGGTGAETAATARTNLGLGNKGYNNSPIYITNSGATQCLGTTMYYQTNVISTNNSTNKSFKVPGVIVACFISMRGDVNNWGIDLTINANSGVMDYSCYGRINSSLEQWAMNAYISPSDTVNMARYSGATTNITCYCATLYVPTKEG